MGVTVREVLDLEPLRRAHPRVLAGGGQLDRAVRWVHVAELADIAYLLGGGELLLSTGMGIAGDEGLQSRYVADLATAGAAGVVIELGRNFDAIPPAMIKAAEERGLPLVALEREARFVEVTECVHRAIINRGYELLRRAEDVSRELTGLILFGAGLGGIVGHLAEVFDNHVVLEDDAHQVVELAGTRAGRSEVLSGWDAHARSSHDEVDRGVVHRCDGPPACIWVGLRLRGDPWGRLHVLETKTRFDEITALLVDRAGSALSLGLLLEKDAAHLAERARSALVGEVAAGRHGSTIDLLRRARTLGADLGGGPLAALAVELGGQPATAGADGQSEEQRLRARLALAEAVRSASRARGGTALVGLVGERVLAVVSMPTGRPAVESLKEIFDDAVERVASRWSQERVVAGASGEADADSVHRTVDEATAALSYARRSPGSRSFQHFSTLGTYRLLLRLAEGPDLARFVESELRALLDHDTGANAVLLPTLRAYLDHAGRKAETVRALGVQRRTLYARIARIERLLSLDLQDQATRTRLSLALQGLELLAERRSRDAELFPQQGRP